MRDKKQPSELDRELIREAGAKEPDFQKIRRLVEQGANPSVYDGSQPLLSSVIWGLMDGYPPETVRLLIELGADVNNGFDLEERPLNDAMFQTNLDVVKWLLDAGADPNFLIDERSESQLDWVEGDRSYHAYHSNDDEMDKKTVAFYDQAIPLLKQYGAKTADDIYTETPSGFVKISRWDVLTARGNLSLDKIQVPEKLILDFESWKNRRRDLFPSGCMPAEFDWHGYNLEGLSLACKIRHYIPEKIKTTFYSINPVDVWYFRSSVEETEIPLGADDSLLLSYDDAESSSRGDVVETALFDIETNYIYAQYRVLAGFRPLPFGCYFNDIHPMIKNGGAYKLRAWHPEDREKLEDQIAVEVEVSENDAVFTMNSEEFFKQVTLRRDTLLASMELPFSVHQHRGKKCACALHFARYFAGLEESGMFSYL